jgi:hypothetical protein
MALILIVLNSIHLYLRWIQEARKPNIHKSKLFLSFATRKRIVVKLEER